MRRHEILEKRNKSGSTPFLDKNKALDYKFDKEQQGYKCTLSEDKRADGKTMYTVSFEEKD